MYLANGLMVDKVVVAKIINTVFLTNFLQRLLDYITSGGPIVLITIRLCFRDKNVLKFNM